MLELEQRSNARSADAAALREQMAMLQGELELAESDAKHAREGISILAKRKQHLTRDAKKKFLEERRRALDQVESPEG